MAATAAISAAVIGAAATVYSVEEQKKAAKRAASTAIAPPTPEMADQSPLNRQRARRAAAANGTAGTLLTGPQGLGSDTSGTRKTLLGS